MTEHSTYENAHQPLPRRPRARTKLADPVMDPGVCPDPATLRELHREIDDYLGNESREMQNA